MDKLRATILLLLVSVSVSAQQKSKIGLAAPPLKFENILNFRKDSADLSEFHSKIVIIDFWASWCSPCIAAFPKLEELQRKFSNDLQIITVTYDSEARIRRFLGKRKFAFPVVMDPNRKLVDHFPHQIIPHTVIIDQDGIIRGITTSSQITEEVITKLITREPLSITEKVDVMTFDSSKPLSGNENLSYQIIVRPYLEGVSSRSNSTGGNGIYANRRIMVINQSAKSLFEIAYQIPYFKTIVEIKDKSSYDWNNLICFDLIVPENLGDQRFKIMQQQLNILYDYRADIETRTLPVKVLRAMHGGEPGLSNPSGGERIVSFSGGRFSMKNSELKSMVDFLAGQLVQPVIDQTGWQGVFNLELDWYDGDQEALSNQLKKLGLELIDDVQPVEVLVISDK